MSIGVLGLMSMGRAPFGAMDDEESDMPITADKFFLEYLVNAGSIDMNVDGSGSTVDFTYTVPQGQEIFISRSNIYIQDAAPSATEFGGIPALTNGLLIEVLDDQGAVLKSFNDARPIRDNSDFISLAGVDVKYDLSSGVDSIAVRWTLERHSGGELLELRSEETFRVRVRDDLSNIDAFRWVIQGRINA